MKLQFAGVTALAFLFTACTAPAGPGPGPITSGSSAPSVAPSVAPSTAPTTGAAAAVDLEAIRKAYKTAAYLKINATPVTSSGAHSGPKFVYVDQANAARYTKDFQGELPVGATIVKTTEDESFFAVMKKRAPGEDPGADQWYYYEAIGGSVVFDGNKTSGGGLCHNCHKFANAKDNLLGLDVYPPK